MKYTKLKTLEGLNIYGKKNTIYLKVEEKFEDDLYRVIEEYNEFTNRFNIISEITQLKRKENYIEICIICNRIEISKFILDNILKSENREKINEELFKIINSDWSYLIEEDAKRKSIPFIKINENEIQLGYGVNSKRILKNDIINLDQLSLKNNGIIPIISVTGTNGKTTTVKLIHNILLNLGYKSGLSSTGGIYIGEEVIRQGDTTGFYSAREVLKNDSVEIAVLETARGGILKKGLGYESAKVAIITSISEDHIGLEGIKTKEDLLNIKGVIAEELINDGALIIKAIDILYNKYKDKDNLILFEYEKNEFIEEHIRKGKKAYYIESDKIIEAVNGIKREIISVKEIPFAFYGISRSNIKNVIAAVAAINIIHNDICDIIDILKTIPCDLKTNLGRQNIIDFNYFRMIIDYGHNSEAFNEVFSISKAMKATKVTALITAAGDREDKYIKELGAISARYADKIIVKEQPDLRDRRIGETANLLVQGALSEGFNKESLSVVLSEEAAIKKALEEAIEGEVIVSFSQFLYLTIPEINKFRKKINLDEIGDEIEIYH